MIVQGICTEKHAACFLLLKFPPGVIVARKDTVQHKPAPAPRFTPYRRAARGSLRQKSVNCMKKSKRWVLVFLLLCFAAIVVYAGVNFYVNPLGYFTNARGLDYYYSDDYVRSIKANYIYSHRNEVEGVIVGGSKAGALNTDLLEQCTGLHYYNLYSNYGNFADYLRYTQFLADCTSVQEITLHLSGYEVEAYDVTGRGNEYKVPAVLSGSPWKRLTEFLGYLMPDYKTTIKTFKKRFSKNRAYADQIENGMKNRDYDMISFKKDPDAFVRRHVVNNQVKRLRKLFLENENDTLEAQGRSDSIEAMRQIKKICDDHGIRLKVVIGASFISERYEYECSAYYNYLYQLVMIAGEVWDFSSFHDININPYNFADGKHYTKAVADLMVNTIYGRESRDGFGILLTPDNILEYTAQRYTDFKNKRGEYLMYGTVFLQDMDDPSYIPLEDYGY